MAWIVPLKSLASDLPLNFPKPPAAVHPIERERTDCSSIRKVHENIPESSFAKKTVDSEVSCGVREGFYIGDDKISHSDLGLQIVLMLLLALKVEVVVMETPEDELILLLVFEIPV
ncbi:hypothetical protein L1887_35940 [Cichorium endivia]|nr:hypothetical protein L1887_35940 [Cichorium endivia]